MPVPVYVERWVEMCSGTVVLEIEGGGVQCGCIGRHMKKDSVFKYR